MTDARWWLPVEVDVHDYGARGDGVTNDTAPLQLAIDAASNAGGGVVKFRRGTYLLGATLTLPSNVELRGAGPDVTILKIANGANVDAIRTKDFATLTGGGTNAGPHGFRITGLAIDGNRDNNNAGNGISIYGYDYLIRDVVVARCSGDGIYSEWGDQAAAPAPHSMEATIDNVKLHDNDVAGLRLRGPHDTVAHKVIVWNNLQFGIIVPAQVTAAYLFVSCHSYGNQQWAWWLEDSVSCVDCHAEGGRQANVAVRADNIVWIGGRVFRDNTNFGTSGFVFGENGQPAITANNTTIQGVRVENCTDGAFIFHTGAGSSRISGLVVSAGVAVTNPGTAAGTIAWDVVVTGGGTLGIGQGSYGIVHWNLTIRQQTRLQLGLYMDEQADPAAPPANQAVTFVRDNGSGKTQLCVRFPTGAVQVLATEP